MNFNNNLPIYVQIMDYIKRQIVSKELGEGDKLPSVRELSTKLKVNPNTIQRSYQELEREDLIFTQRGMGTFVTEDENKIKKLKNDMASSVISNFIRDMKTLGFSIDDMVKLINESVKEG